MPSVHVLTSAHRVDDVRIFHKQVKALAKICPDITIFGRAPIADDLAFASFEVIESPYKSRSFRSLLFFVRYLSFFVSDKPRILHIHDPELIPFFVFLRLFSKFKLVIDFHEHIEEDIKTKSGLGFYKKLFALLIFKISLKFSRAFTDLFVFASSEIAAEIGPSRNRSIVFRNFPTNSLPVYDSANTSSDSAVYIGRISLDRGFNEMIELSKKIGIKVRMIGTPDDALVERIKIEPSVEWIGQQPYSLMPNLVKDSRFAFCFLQDTGPYRFAIPTKLLEYLSWGLPVVCSDLPKQGEIIRASGAGIILPNKLDKATLDEFCSFTVTPESLMAASKNGIEFISSEIDWSNEEKQLLSSYSHLLNLS